MTLSQSKAERTRSGTDKIILWFHETNGSDMQVELKLFNNVRFAELRSLLILDGKPVIKSGNIEGDRLTFTVPSH